MDIVLLLLHDAEHVAAVFVLYGVLSSALPAVTVVTLMRCKSPKVLMLSSTYNVQVYTSAKQHSCHSS